MTAPAFTVVIPTFDRPVALAACLKALAELEPPSGGFEVVVVDDGGSVDASTVTASFTDRLDLRLIRQANAGPATARNAGARAARGDVLAFTDDDCRPEPGWLVAFDAVLSRGDPALCGGRTYNRIAHDPFADASQLLIDYFYEEARGEAHGVAFFTSNNLAVDRVRFLELGGFDAEYPLAAAEDRDLCARWTDRGLPLRFVEVARVAHYHALDLRRFLAMHARYGRGAAQFRSAQKRRGGALGRHTVAFYRGMLSYPFGQASWPRALELSCLVGLAQVAHSAGFIAERAEAHRRRG